MKSLFLTLLLLAFGVVSFARSDDTAKSKLEANHPAVADRLQEATTMLKEIFAAPDQGVPSDLLAKAKCVIAIPNEKKAAFGIGGVVELDSPATAERIFWAVRRARGSMEQNAMAVRAHDD